MNSSPSADNAETTGSDSDAAAASYREVLTHGSKHINVVTSEGLNQVLADHRDVVAWVTTDWCGPCAQIAPHLDEFAGANSDRVAVVAIDGDANFTLQRHYQIIGYPTLLAFHDGRWIASNPTPEPESPSSSPSADDFAQSFLPLFERAELFARAEHSSSDIVPAPTAPPARGARTVTLPDLGEDATYDILQTSGEQQYESVSAGTHELPAGADLSVTLKAVPGGTAAIDLSVLDRFDAHTIDVLTIDGAPVDVDELATHPSVDSIYGLTMFEGDGGISDAILDRFPRLRRVDAEFSGPPPAALDRVICNFSWVSPELSPR